LHYFAVPIAQKRVVELGEVDEGFLGKYRVGADPQYFGILSLELRVVVRTGRFEALNSRRTEVKHVKIDQNVFAFQIAELEFAAASAVKLEVGSLVANLKGGCVKARYEKQCNG
jgi:hypothetical protein